MTDIKKLSQLVNRPDWDQYMVWLSELRVDAHERLELTTPDKLGGIQGELRIINRMLTLRNTVNTMK